MTTDPHAVQISVDGSCYPDERRKSGYAGVVVYPDDPTEHEVVLQGFKESTINRMELSACIAAMEWVREEQVGRRYSTGHCEFILSVSKRKTTDRHFTGQSSVAWQ
jgi:ribonuclease HI